MSNNNDNPYGQPPSEGGEPSSYPQQGGSSGQGYGQGQQGGSYPADQGSYGQGQQGGGYPQQGGYDQQSGYESAPQSYGNDQYAAQGQGGYAGQGVAGQRPLAPWGKRAIGFLIDDIGPSVVYYVIYIVAFAIGKGLGIAWALIGGLALLAFTIWNRWVKGGQGQTIGRKQVGVTLIGAKTGQPIGTGMAFVRDIAHFVDSVICYIGWLFPLWDSQRQTLADKIMSTVVVEV